MILERLSKLTLTPFGLNHGDIIQFALRGGQNWQMKLLNTSAEILGRDPTARGNHDEGKDCGDVSVYAFSCDLLVNGREVHIQREVASQASFYDPLEVDGVNIWFDAASCAFRDDGGFMAEKDWMIGMICKPAHKARFAIHEADLSICPEPISPWYPNDEGRLDIRDCYCGEDCWMGPYSGASAHCGLDINMRAGTILSAPISLDNHYLFASTACGFVNNRWRGERRWTDGSTWRLQTHHLIQMLVPQGAPIQRGTPYATTAGVMVGLHEHTHFNFEVIDQGGQYWLDPWIIFWQMFKDQKTQMKPNQ